MPHSFAKTERLKSKEAISLLFKEGQFMRKKFLALKFLAVEGEPSIKVAFSVPKRRFPKAVDRNRLKRRMLEAYRLNKDLIATADGQALHLILIYNSAQEFDFQSIEAALQKLFLELNNQS